ncbi:MAG: urease subunit gamma [Alphaproteobacteria bacterium]|nr:urease subunit gamma [Rhodospirillaceae bacterium]MBT6510639.1 urease subunit gamma [Rhodospirillaceae bacterium]MBT7613993.1 urease subunit gamma [Rhodospirillaceae bacterium]MDG2482170.1 urease subunit gamma [Alphaproteobacteria bacterium]
MILTPTEMERMTIFVAGEMARRRKEKGLKLNHPEAQAYIVDALLEGAREGRIVSDLVGWGATLLTTDDVMVGVRRLMPMIQVEGLFPDGAKLITVHDPVRPGTEPIADSNDHRAGEVITPQGTIKMNQGRACLTLTVLNTGDRPVQIGSHLHFFEANAALEFDREASFGMRLDVPAGVSRRFEPGQGCEVELVGIGGKGIVTGFQGLTEGSVHDPEVKAAALQRARERGFRGA